MLAALRSAALAVALLLALVPCAARAVDDPRVLARAKGTDLGAARRIAAALLVRPPAAQLLEVRCERVGPHLDCGLILSGVKFHRRLDLASWDAEVSALLAGAYAAEPSADEIDCWATVPLTAHRGEVVSGDYAQPTSANVFSITVPRAGRATVAARLRSGQGVFWDPAFRASLSKGTDG
ncbi:MAG TPA: hypothetical protein VMD91_01380 [Candidatus Sulfotelmatobacter sp.]|nr:hypothetical protein [Candidatus Sulfotelmatobacter sp.]